MSRSRGGDGPGTATHYLPYGHAERWAYWQPEQRRQLLQVWPGSGTRRRAANGDEYELRSRIVDLDPREQRLTLQMRAVLWRTGQRVAEEEYTLQENLYFRNELLLLLPTRVEGTRRKHHRGPLALKLYDKQALGLRLETTVNEVWFFQHHRTGTIAPARPTPRSRPCARRSRAWHPCARCCSPPTGALWPSSLT